jgi:hypothetical protein
MCFQFGFYCFVSRGFGLVASFSRGFAWLLRFLADLACLVASSLTDFVRLPCSACAADGYGSPRFLEVAQGFHPHGIPWSEARGGAGVAVKKVKRYLAKMDKAVNYDYYDDDELRYTRFKSPFDRRPLIDRRTRHRYLVALRPLLPLVDCNLECPRDGEFHADYFGILMGLICDACDVRVQEE